MQNLAMVRNLRKRRLSSPSPSNRARPPPPSSAPPDTTEIAGPETITIAPDGDVTLILMRDVETLVTDNKVTQEVRIQVSSEKLSRASPVFKAMLRGNFREEVDLRSGGHVKIHLPDDDPDYFAVLLDAIHDRDGKCRQIPSLENLAGLCSLIDKYFLLEGVAQSLKYWLKKVKPKRFSDETELGKLIYIYWTTQRPKPLSSIMSQAVVWLRSPLTQDKFQFLVPTWIIDNINIVRNSAIVDVFQYISRFCQWNWEAGTFCTSHCGIMQLNAMLEAVGKHRCLHARDPPYHNISLRRLKDALRRIPEPHCPSVHDELLSRHHLKGSIKRSLMEIDEARKLMIASKLQLPVNNRSIPRR